MDLTPIVAMVWMSTKKPAVMSNAYNKYDGLACSENVGREANTGADPLHPEIICPQMTVNRKPLLHPTMSLSQCIDRIKVGNPCTIKCKVLDQLRKED